MPDEEKPPMKVVKVEDKAPPKLVSVEENTADGFNRGSQKHKRKPGSVGDSVSELEEDYEPTPDGVKLLTDWFDRVFIINCQHRPDRLEAITEELTKKRLADMDKVTIYPAIIGDYTTHPAGWGGGNGAWGCLQSHRRIMEDLMHDRDERKSMAWESALILEDDVYFLPNAMQDLAAFMQAVPSDWGQIYLGGQHLRRANKIPELEKVLHCVSVNRTHAYAINRGTIHEIYRHISYMADYHSNKHIDHQLELAHQRKDWPVYSPAKWICGQRAGTSNVSGKNDPARTWQ